MNPPTFSVYMENILAKFKTQIARTFPDGSLQHAMRELMCDIREREKIAHFYALGHKSRSNRLQEILSWNETLPNVECFKDIENLQRCERIDYEIFVLVQAQLIKFITVEFNMGIYDAKFVLFFLCSAEFQSVLVKRADRL